MDEVKIGDKEKEEKEEEEDDDEDDEGRQERFPAAHANYALLCTNYSHAIFLVHALSIQMQVTVCYVDSNDNSWYVYAD
jgi:hypothetical protein